MTAPWPNQRANPAYYLAREEIHQNANLVGAALEGRPWVFMFFPSRLDEVGEVPVLAVQQLTSYFIIAEVSDYHFINVLYSSQEAEKEPDVEEDDVQVAGVRGPACCEFAQLSEKPADYPQQVEHAHFADPNAVKTASDSDDGVTGEIVPVPIDPRELSPVGAAIPEDVPAGKCRSREAAEATDLAPVCDRYITAFPAIYQQGAKRLCVPCSMACAMMHFTGSETDAAELIESFERARNKSQEGDHSLLIHCFQGVYGSQFELVRSTSQRWTDRSRLPYSAILEGEYGSRTHAVAIWDGMVFDSNVPCALPLSKETLDFCCLGSFVRLGSVVKVVRNERHKRERRRHNRSKRKQCRHKP